MYSIGQVSQMFDLPVSTLRYYDKEGLFNDVQRESGIRKFSDKALESLRMIECLKNQGLKSRTLSSIWLGVRREAKHIRKERKCLKSKKRRWKRKLKRLNKTLAMLNFKCW